MSQPSTNRMLQRAMKFQKLQQGSYIASQPSTSTAPVASSSAAAGGDEDNTAGSSSNPTAGRTSLAAAQFAAYMAATDASPDQDPLDWWRHNMPSFGMLIPLVRKYLAVLATSAIVEGSFSKAKRWCKDQRSSISGTKLDVMTVLDTALTSLTEEELDEFLPTGAVNKYGRAPKTACDPLAQLIVIDGSDDGEDNDTVAADRSSTPDSAAACQADVNDDIEDFSD